MTSIRSRPRDTILFFISSIGVGITTLLAAQHGSALTRVLLVTISGFVFLSGATVAYVAYSSVTFWLVADSRLRRASKILSAPSNRIDSALDVPPGTIESLQALLAEAANEVAVEQRVEESQVRAALFRKHGEVLRIIPGLTWHLDEPEEQQIEIPPGEGSAGRAFEESRPNIAIYHDARNDTSLKDPHQRSRVDVNLKWIISVPILGQENQVLGVLNVDGLTTEKTEGSLEVSVKRVIYWAELAGLLLGAKGDERMRVPNEA
jgi:hypothetical protein